MPLFAQRCYTPSMSKQYEYKFVRIKAGFFSRKPERDYQEVVQREAGEGWRLVQIFAPSTAAYGSVGYYELIFEKDKSF
jgi:hypothetical protein